MKPENQDDALREVRLYVGMDDPGTEALRKERAAMAAQVEATVQAKRRGLEDVGAAKTRVGRQAEPQLREVFANGALCYHDSRTDGKLLAAPNARPDQREHSEHESPLIDYCSRGLPGTIK